MASSSSSCCGNVTLTLSCFDPVSNIFLLEADNGSFDLAIAECSPFNISFIGSIILDNCLTGNIVINTNPNNPFCSSSSISSSSISSSSISSSSISSSSVSSSSRSSSSHSSTSGISTECCGLPVPGVLFATFGGSLSALGTVTLTFSIASWVGIPPAGTCLGSQPQITFACLFGGASWRIVAAGLSGSFDSSGDETSCDPFLWSAVGVGGGGCIGAYTITVTS